MQWTNLAEKDLPVWSQAVWSPLNESMRIKLDPKGLGENDLMSFRHELTHAITVSSIDSTVYKVPSWFYEGAATFYEQAQPYYDMGREGVLYKAFKDNKLISFNDIADDPKNWSTDN